MSELTRRRFLQAGSAATAASLAGAMARPAHAADSPLDATRFPALDAQDEMPWLGLATTLADEHRYRAEVRGRIPEGLRGTLYRNGPGRFDRGGLRKQCVLDGDGMLQRFAFGDDGVDYQNRFTRTEKYLAEEASGEYEFATWTTRAPGGMFANMFASAVASQAGVSVHRKGDVVYAFDESSAPYEVDPESFETLGRSRLGVSEAHPEPVYSAHPKTCAATGEWLHFGLGYGRESTAHLRAFAPDGRLVWGRRLPFPRYVYVHDWFVTERHLVFLLHPAEVAIYGFLFGRRSLAGSFRWRPEQGNLLWIVPRGPSGDPVAIETDAAWMWHSLNAYERGGEIVADFVGYDAPDDFIGDDPAFWSMMEGRLGASSPGSLRRYVIDPAAGRVRVEPLLTSGSSEFPIVNPARTGLPHRYGYLARAVRPEPFGSQVVRVDTETGDARHFDFGAGQFCAEPVFVPDPGAPGEGAREPGWLLTQVYDARSRRSRLAILDAERVPDGPVAEVLLRHHVPLSFHGSFHPA